MPGGAACVLPLRAAPLHRVAGAPLSDGQDVPPVTTPRLPAREGAEHELSKPEYHQHDPNLLQRAVDWLWRRLGDLLSTAAEATPGGWVGLLTVCLLGLLLLLALRLRLGKLRPGPASGASNTLFTPHPRSAAEHRSSATAHAEAGHWTAAVQERMRALVRSLEERVLLEPRPGRTADEAAAEAGRTLPEHAARLRAAARAFDEVTYADRQADRAAYEELTALDTALLDTPPHLPNPASTARVAADPTAPSPPGGAR